MLRRNYKIYVQQLCYLNCLPCIFVVINTIYLPYFFESSDSQSLRSSLLDFLPVCSGKPCRISRQPSRLAINFRNDIAISFPLRISYVPLASSYVAAFSAASAAPVSPFPSLFASLLLACLNIDPRFFSLDCVVSRTPDGNRAFLFL